VRNRESVDTTTSIPNSILYYIPFRIDGTHTQYVVVDVTGRILVLERLGVARTRHDNGSLRLCITHDISSRFSIPAAQTHVDDLHAFRSNTPHDSFVHAGQVSSVFTVRIGKYLTHHPAYIVVGRHDTGRALIVATHGPHNAYNVRRVPRTVRVTPIIVRTETAAHAIGTPLLGILAGHVGVIELDATVNDGFRN
jgi:hypothetical protein